MRRFSFPCLIAAVGLLAGCGVGGPFGPSAPFDPSAETTFCVNEVNRYRNIAGLQPLTVTPALEAFATESARTDTVARQPHLHFTQTNGGGVALAENELLWWPSRNVHAIIAQELAAMWAEGPSGDHHQNMAGPYTQVGCGIFVSGHEMSAAQDFR